MHAIAHQFMPSRPTDASRQAPGWPKRERSPAPVQARLFGEKPKDIGAPRGSGTSDCAESSRIGQNRQIGEIRRLFAFCLPFVSKLANLCATCEFHANLRPKTAAGPPPARPASHFAPCGRVIRSANRQRAGWPVSRVLCAAPRSGRWPFIWNAGCPALRAVNPDGAEGGPAPKGSSLCNLAPGGACRAASVSGRAVGSYPTVSPLPARSGRSVLCGAFPRVPASFRPPSPAGRYPAPCLRGARTFLTPKRARDHPATRRPQYMERGGENTRSLGQYRPIRPCCAEPSRPTPALPDWKIGFRSKQSCSRQSTMCIWCASGTRLETEGGTSQSCSGFHGRNFLTMLVMASRSQLRTGGNPLPGNTGTGS